VNPVAFVPLFEVGLLVGVLAWRSGSIWPGIFAHAANNLVSSAQYFATQGGPAPTEATPSDVLTWFAIGNVLIVAVALLAWKRPALLASPRPAAAVPTEPGKVASLVRGGLAVMVLGYGAMVGLDFRGAEAHVADQIVWLPKLPADATSDQKAGRVVVEAERKKLLAGKSSFEAYLAERREQRKREAK
jgi:membrane protease YdiL (CAAX protease family)